MTDEKVSQTDRSSHASHGGQSVNIVFSTSWKIAAILATMMLAMMLFAQRSASQAELKANQAIKTAEDSQTENRLMQLWAQKVANYCEKDGHSFPAIPTSYK